MLPDHTQFNCDVGLYHAYKLNYACTLRAAGEQTMHAAVSFSSQGQRSTVKVKRH